MKRYLFVLFLLTLLTSCEDEIMPSQHTVSILIDRTDPEGYAPSGEFILRALPKVHLADGLELSITNIGDTHYNERQSFLLEKGETGWLANEDKRRKQYKFLKKQFADSLTAFNARDYQYIRSDIFRSLAKELNRLGRKKGKRALWLFSDLKEHSFFSVYNPKDVYRLAKDPEKVAREFESSIPLVENLSGVTLVIIYKPTLDDTELFSQLVRLYRTILEPKGGIIKIGIQNQIRL
ncbi:MAG: hypothetical protein GKR88_19395 [Flavobacteriaceae bacterium]|nr:MAG: hypothetical protein GKR88_19395 [Flavobacteriaceae bacterium]